jgi:hypothetical protein
MAKPKTPSDPRYADWYAVYVEECRERVKHWGDKRVSAIRSAGPDGQATHNATDLDGSLFASGR